MTLLEGSANLRGKVAYVPQQAWMQNATLKDNVLFGRKYKKDLYQRVRDILHILYQLKCEEFSLISVSVGSVGPTRCSKRPLFS